MQASLRPHRGGSVLALGILGLVPLVGVIPFGIPAWVMGSNDLRGMDLNQVDASGRKLTRAGRVCGVVGTVIWLMLFPMFVVMYGGRDAWQVSADGHHPHAFATTIRTSTYPSGERESQVAVVPDASGSLVKDGPFVRWTRAGRKLEQGIYTDDKRTGPWTFWNEDGSVDRERSGVYENDVKVGD